jgi:hypothetical protein
MDERGGKNKPLLGRTLLYFDLQAEAEKAPAKRWRERLPRRTATAEA